MKKFMFVMVLGLFLGSSAIVLADEVVVETPVVVEETPVVEPTPDPIVCVAPEVLVGDTCTTPVKKHRSSGYMMPLQVVSTPVYVWDIVKLGDKGQDVKDFQVYLNNKGAKLTVDGFYGPLTLAAWNLVK